MKYIFLFLLILGFSNTSNQLQAQNCSGVSVSDSLELVKFYETLDGDNWKVKHGWLIKPVEDWYGISLTTDKCRVKEIFLYENGLSGAVPNLDLPNLHTLVLLNDDVKGYIPNFSNLPNLVTLSLVNNQLSNIIPDFSNLPELKNLYLTENNLGGNIPNFSNLPNLRQLSLAQNQFIGNIPDFSGLSNLIELDLSNNQLNGEIPNFNHLPNLEALVLAVNQLTGSIPNFSNLPLLQELYLKGNELEGNIPNFSELSNLTYLNLNYNNLTGTVPNFNLPNLGDLHIGFNELNGNLPIFNNIPQLKTLYLYENKLNGNIPDFDLPNLSSLVLAKNNISGTIPNFSNLASIEHITLSDNQLSGYIPNFTNLPSLTYLRVCPGNNLIAPIPNFDNSLFFEFEPIYMSCIQTATVTGTAFHDQNQNCLQDEGEVAIPNTKITVNDSLFYTYTDENGFYKLQLDTGTYQITATPPNFLWQQNCPENPNYYTIIIENYNDSIPNQDFGLKSEEECTFLTIDIATPLQRRCFMNTYTVQYCNEGTKSADSAYVELTFPPDIIPLNASIPFEENGNVWSFDLDTLVIGECGSFTVTDSVSCNAVLGSTACVEARIYPAFLCREVSSLWDGSDLVIEGECIDNEFIEFTITNIGEDMQDSIEYRIYEDDILSSLDKLKLMEGDSKELSIAATGATYRLKAEQSNFHPFESIPQAVVELCGEEPYSLGFVSSQSNSDLEHFIDIDCQEIIGSFDPNDKTVQPTGIADQHYIAEGTELTYKIRFQNTGSDTAFRVSIIDTLKSDFLDLRTFKITNTSHPYNARIADENVLIVEFDNILLPDSTTNEPESHGFVQYKITPFQDAPKNSIITNLGDIYFDYNQPITTNTVFNTIGIPLLDVTLPIELLQFDAYLDNRQNTQLTWITASEINNSHFEILRSSDGKHFPTIGKIEGKGTTSQLHSYQFEDSNLPTTSSTVYYRLKQIDFNGQYSYSKVVSLFLQNESTAKIWYNTLQNNIEVVTNQSHQLQIFDAVGRMVKNVSVIEGRQTIGTEDLASGIYTYQLQQNGSLKSRQTNKFVLVRN